MGKKAALGILIFSAFLRLWISDFKLVFLDYDAFYHARMARIIYETGALPSWDYQELGGVPYYYPPVYHILIAFFKYLFPSLDFLLIGSILNLLFGLASIGMLYLILKEMIGENIALLSCAIYAFTPVIIIRTALLARPIGIAYFFAVLSLYFFLKIFKSENLKSENLEKIYILSAFLVFLIFSFTHSLFSVFFLILILETIFFGKNKRILLILMTSVVIIWVAYNFDFIINHFEPSLGYTAEYQPFLSRERLAGFLTGNFWDLVAAFLYLANGNLAYFPLIMHGIYLSAKRKFLPILALFSFLSAFFKSNVFALFLFYAAVCIALSIDELNKRLGGKKGKLVSAFLITFIFTTNLFISMMLISLTKKNFQSHSDEISAIKEAFEAVPLTEKEMILPNNLNLGHAIAYYTPAMVYLSDLTDTKKWRHNARMYNRLRNAAPAEAENIIRKENITHIFHFLTNRSEFSGFSWVTQLNFTKIYEKNYKTKNITAELYRIN